VRLPALEIADDLPRVAEALLLAAGDLPPYSANIELGIVEQIASFLLDFAGEDLRDAFDLV
jgi:hypothetical protein